MCAVEYPPLIPRLTDPSTHEAACHFPVADGEDLALARPTLAPEERIVVEPGALSMNADEEVAVTQGIGDAISAGDSAVLLEPLAPGAPGAKAIRGRSPFALAFDRLRRDRGAMISLGVIILIVLIAIAAPLFASLLGHPPNHQYRTSDALSASGQPHAPSSGSLPVQTTRAVTCSSAPSTAPAFR